MDSRFTKEIRKFYFTTVVLKRNVSEVVTSFIPGVLSARWWYWGVSARSADCPGSPPECWRRWGRRGGSSCPWPDPGDSPRWRRRRTRSAGSGEPPGRRSGGRSTASHPGHGRTHRSGNRLLTLPVPGRALANWAPTTTTTVRFAMT